MGLCYQRNMHGRKIGRLFAVHALYEKPLDRYIHGGIKLLHHTALVTEVRTKICMSVGLNFMNWTLQKSHTVLRQESDVFLNGHFIHCALLYAIPQYSLAETLIVLWRAKIKFLTNGRIITAVYCL